MADSAAATPAPAFSRAVAAVTRVFRRAFDDPDLERLYQAYSLKQKRSGVQCFVLAAAMYDAFMLAIPGQDPLARGLTATFLGLNLALLAWCMRPGRLDALWAAVPHLAWFLADTQLLVLLFVKKNEVTGRDSLGWALLLDYLLYVTLPLRLRYCVMLSIGTCASYMVTVAGLAGKSDSFVGHQLGANVFLLLTTNILGLMSYHLADKQQRGAFLETRQSLEMKLAIEEQSAEQETLLLSVLPEHVAVKMRQDLGSGLDSQFKKIYMSRHENVSILYADIVGFTAISSTYSASDLVKILNELFARFDRLSEKYHQLRIKILGDCYYCISGAPVERPDHAVLCVHMGLSMVDAIKYVQQTTNSPVDMRVGIHTGAVLAGVLGQRQWQFDVYSKDVEFANKMESSGMAGRVHISEVTLSFLNDEFEVEPAYGERREETLRMAGIKTYFIVRTLKPFKDEAAEVRNGSGAVTDKEDEITATEEGSRVLGSGREREDSEDFKKRLRKEVMSRDGIRDLTNQTNLLSLSFVDSKKEHDYNHHKESFASIAILGCPIVYIMTTIAKCIVLPRYLVSEYFITIDLIVLVLLPVSSIAEFFPSVFSSPIVMCSKRANNTLWKRRVLGIAIVLLLSLANIIDMVRCSLPAPLIANMSINATEEVTPTSFTTETDIAGETCLFPSYFSVFGVLALIATALPAQLPHLAKVALLVIVALAHCLVNVFLLGPGLDQEEEPNLRDWPNLLSGKYTLSGLLVIVTISLCILCRHTEQALRVLFLWRTEVEEQGERAADMRRRNEALVYNILPPHVAAHFMGSRTRQHEELYAQSYAEVGVLFASMPNFSDFYTEESVNNQGLECLRFLNEVISDFDALLELPQFADIIKIKTIGSTYMAASGLNPSMQVKPDDPIQVRWAHLSLLVEFAFELKKALQSINEQSFNHFVLKMGINHGPITAGVIGARKPHYDIWGNSVNVASRMESTGKAGCIQVTEETCNILQNFGYVFEQRGLVSVKGKGQLMTYYLVGKGFGGVVGGNSPTPGGVTPSRAANGSALNGGPLNGVVANAAAVNAAAPNGNALTEPPTPMPERPKSASTKEDDEECDESAALLPRPAEAPSESVNAEIENDSETKRLLSENENSKPTITNSPPVDNS